MLDSHAPSVTSPLLEQASRCQQNRRRLSKRIHKKNKLLTEVYKSQKIATSTKTVNLTSILRKCHLPEVLSDWLLTKRMTGINSINSLLTLASKAMSQHEISLIQISSYSSRQQSITQELMSSGIKTPQKRQSKGCRSKIKFDRTIDTNVSQPMIIDFTRMKEHEDILDIPFNVSQEQLDQTDFLRMF